MCMCGAVPHNDTDTGGLTARILGCPARIGYPHQSQPAVGHGPQRAIVAAGAESATHTSLSRGGAACCGRCQMSRARRPRGGGGSLKGRVTGSGLALVSAAGFGSACARPFCIVGSGSVFSGSGLGSSSGFLNTSRGSGWFWWRVVCIGGPVAGLRDRVVWRVEGVAAVEVLLDAPVVLMDFVVTVPADHYQVVEAGGAAFGIRGDVVGLAHARRRPAMKTAAACAFTCVDSSATL